MSKTDELLAQLNECSKYNGLNESIDRYEVGDRFLRLKKDLLSSVGLTNAVLDDNKLSIIREVRSVPINPSLRVVTYPNIHFDKKYNIEGLVLFEFVLKKINEHANSNNRLSFNTTDVVQEAISYTLKYLIGKTPSKQITIDEFKREYQLYAFGSYKKIQLRPKVIRLISLANNSPYIISYIDNNLIYRQINNLTEYSKKVEKDFDKLLKNDPNLKYTLNSYMGCIERSIRALVNIYKIIRNTFIELQNEYFSIFRQIIRVNKVKFGAYKECCDETNNYIKSLNENIENFENSSDIHIDFESNAMGIEFIKMIQKRIDQSDEIINSTYGSLGLVSKLDCSNKYTLNVPNGLYNINSLNIKDYINSINKLLNDCKDLSELSIKSSNILCNKIVFNDINDLRIYLLNNIYTDKTNINIELDLLINNIINLLSLANYIKNNFYLKLLNTSFSMIDDLNKYNYFKNIMIGVLSIVDTIYFNVLNNFKWFIDLIKDLI